MWWCHNITGFMLLSLCCLLKLDYSLLVHVLPLLQTSGQTELQFLSLTCLVVFLLHPCHIVSTCLTDVAGWVHGMNSALQRNLLGWTYPGCICSQDGLSYLCHGKMMARVVAAPWEWPSTAEATAQSLRRSVAVLNLHTYPLMLSTLLKENISLSKGRTLYQGVLATNTEGLSSTNSCIPEVEILSVCCAWRKRGLRLWKESSQTPHIFWTILDKCNRNGIVGKSDSFLAFNTSSADIFKGKNEQR